MMFRSLADPSQMGPAVSVALLTTLYGVLLANLLLLPIAAHLRERSEEDLSEMEAVLDGVLMIHEAVNPNLIARRLASGDAAVPAAAGNGNRPRAESRHAGPAFDRGRVPARA
ncbi:MAG: MotA/TolQ/ExbB proton channel family protein [Nitrospirae bacterium]|nr:MotA/TolQ/ExbB proton channel family protein [Nitrospirota bacterium]